MISNADQLIVINHKKLEIAHKNIGLALVFLISIVVVVIITSMFFIRRSIIKPIARLYEGAAIIGSGNLNYKVGIKTKDEIGELSDAFNRMTDNLNVVTVSRDELTKEINERKQTEMALQESEEIFSQFLYHSPIYVFFKDNNPFNFSCEGWFATTYVDFIMLAPILYIFFTI